MDTNTSWPLNEQHLACCNAVLASAPRTAELLQKCKACGLDVEEAMRQNQEHLNKAQAIKAQFFPGHP